MDMNGHPLAQDPWGGRPIFVHKLVPSSLSWFEFIFQICKLLCYLILVCNPLGVMLQYLELGAYNSQSLTLCHTDLRQLQQQHFTVHQLQKTAIIRLWMSRMRIQLLVLLPCVSLTKLPQLATNEPLKGFLGFRWHWIWSLLDFLTTDSDSTRFLALLATKAFSIEHNYLNATAARRAIFNSSTTTLESLGNTKRNLWIESATASRVDRIARLWIAF